MAFDPINNSLIDPFNGAKDLKNEIIRCVGNPLDRFNEDGLRIMRAARFASRFGYRVEAETQEAMREALDTLKKVSIERVKDEIWKTLNTLRPSIGLKLMREIHILSMIELEWDSFNLKDIIVKIDCMFDAEVETKFALLCSWFSIKAIENLAKKLKLSNVELKKITFLRTTLELYHEFAKDKNPYTARKFLAHARNNAPGHHAHSLQEFLILTDALELNARETLEKYQGETVWARCDLKIDGNDLMAMGVAPGPEIKRILAAAYDLILKNPQANEERELKAFAETMR